MDNDAKALALGEGWVGAATGYDDYIAMVVSTGVGGGIVLDGRLLNGRLGNAGHIGHVVVVPDGRHCPCGSRGCLEAEASGTALEALTGQPARLAPPEWVERTGMLVGRAISSVAVLLDLSLAVVSGSVALGFGEPFFAAAQTQMDQLCRIDVRPRGACGAGRSGRRWTADRRRPGRVVAGRRGGGGVRRSWGRDAGVVLRAVGPRPRLWWASAGAMRRMARRGWWHRAPFVPLPGEAYWRFRLETAYGGDGESGELSPADVVAFLHWCQRSRPRRG